MVDPLTAAREALAYLDTLGRYESRPNLEPHLRAALAEADRLRALLTLPTDAERVEWTDLCEEATPGPWGWDATMEQLTADGAWLDFTGPDDPDTLLVITARTALPRLLAALAAAEGERDALAHLRAYLDGIANEDDDASMDAWRKLSTIDRARLNALAARGGEDDASVRYCAGTIADEKARVAKETTR